MSRNYYIRHTHYSLTWNFYDNLNIAPKKDWDSSFCSVISLWTNCQRCKTKRGLTFWVHHPVVMHWGILEGTAFAAPRRPSLCTWTWNWAATSDQEPSKTHRRATRRRRWLCPSGQVFSYLELRNKMFSHLIIFLTVYTKILRTFYVKTQDISIASILLLFNLPIKWELSCA